jgi:adenylate cyclase
LRGRLRVAGPGAKLSLSLIMPDTGMVAWSGMQEGPAGEVYELIDSVTHLADDALRVEINAFDGRRIADLPDGFLSASELRTRAAHCFYKATVPDYRRAVALLEKSLVLTPENGMSLAMWAHAQVRLACAGFGQPDAAFRDDIAARADAAVEAMPESDFVEKTRAEVRIDMLRDVAGTRRSLERVNRLNPNYRLTHHVEAELALAEGDYAAAAGAARKLVAGDDRDPFRPVWLYVRAVAELLAGQPAAAMQAIGEAIELCASCRS